MKKLIFDLDGTINYTPDFKTYTPEEFLSAKPRLNVIKKIQELYKNNEIIIFTSRGWFDEDHTRVWLAKHNVPYHDLIFGKPIGDFYIDDIAINLKQFEGFGYE